MTEVLKSFNSYTEAEDGPDGGPFKLRCLLSEPATMEEIRSAWPTEALPAELVEEWSISRESHLFEDVEYGQWGLGLLSPSASAAATAEVRIKRSEDFSPDDIVIGEFIGDLELLVIAQSETGSQRILVALPLGGRSDWYVAASSLAQFLQKYRDSTGDKYWEATDH